MFKIIPLPVALLVLSSLTVHSAEKGQPETAPVIFQEIARKTVNLGEHTATYVKIRPPVLPKSPPPPPPRVLTEAERTRMEELAEKDYVNLNVSATVYLDGGRVLTELRWRGEETGSPEYRAYSNADFRYLTQLHHLETETAVYAWFPFVDTWDLADWPADQKRPLPQTLRLSETETEYLLDSRTQGIPAQEALLAGLDYLHAYYQLHYAELKAAYEQRMAENAKRERELRENPPKPANTVLRFWLKTPPAR